MTGESNGLIVIYVFLEIYFLHLVFMSDLPVCITHVLGPQRPEDHTGSTGMRVTWLLVTTWVPGTEPQSFIRAANALNSWALPPGPRIGF